MVKRVLLLIWISCYCMDLVCMGWGFGRMGSGGCLGFVGGFILGGLFE